MKHSAIALAPLLALMISGCGLLNATFFDSEQEALRLSVQALKVESEDAQRTVIELRAELAAHREELARARVVRAQQEGRLREAEQRYAEARHVVALQREELAQFRADKESVLTSGRELQANVRHLQLQLARLIQDREKQRAGVRGGRQGSLADGDAQQARPLIKRTARTAKVGTMAGVEGVGNGTHAGQQPGRPELVYVRRGDTLWAVARRYGVNFAELRALNHLDRNPDLIFPGQALLLPPAP